MTYDTALKPYQSAVSAKYPPDIVQGGRPTRRVNQVNAQGGRGRGHGRGNGGRGGGRGRGRRGRHGDINNENYHPNQYPVRLQNGKTINVHSSFYLDPQTYLQLPEEATRRLLTEKAEYKRQRAERTIASLSSDCFG